MCEWVFKAVMSSKLKSFLKTSFKAVRGVFYLNKSFPKMNTHKMKELEYVRNWNERNG